MPLTWLHISDFHIRPSDPYDRDVVLRALVQSVARLRSTNAFAPDLIIATGDIAHSGKPAEYEIAETFLNQLLAAANVSRDRLFLIPGNHDIDRSLATGLARTLDSREQSDAYFAPDAPKPHLSYKLRAYLNWYEKYFAGIRKPALASTCGPVELINLNSVRLALLPINSALFCLDDNDHAKLWIGRRCLDQSLATLPTDADLTIALVHHPLEWLHPTEASNIQASLESHVDLLLRGHLHETRIESVVSPEGAMLRLAAGATYQSAKWPNRALCCTYDDGAVTISPIAYIDSPTEVWTTDPSVFPLESTHQKTFTILSRRTARKSRPVSVPQPQAPARFRSNINSRGNRPFVGREPLLQQLAQLLPDPTHESVIVLHGPPGVGKSELAREFARLHKDCYPGGTFFIDASSNSFAINLAAVGQNFLELPFPTDSKFDDRALQTFAALGAAPTLLIYDNVVSFPHAQPWLPFAGMPCNLLITTLLDESNPAWPRLELKPLTEEQSLDLIAQVTDDQLTPADAQTIADHAQGLPVQILPDAATLAYELRRGRSAPAKLNLADHTNQSFRAAYERLDQRARLLLRASAFFNTQHLPASELSLHFIEALKWTDGDIQRTFDSCLDLHLLENWPNPRMHQLFAHFLRETPLQADDQLVFDKLVAVQVTRFVKLAGQVESNPANLEVAALFLDYPLIPETWLNLGQQPSVSDGETVGGALCEVGRFDEARAWFERGVTEQEKRDLSGRVDHEALGSSLHDIGYCLFMTDHFDEALPFLERAVSEREKGDLQERINHPGLAASAHTLGHCLSRTGRQAEAWSCFERAVAEYENGTVQGRSNHNGLGRALHQLGYGRYKTGHYEEALPWFKRAVEEAEKGDETSRIDHETLGRSLDLVGDCLTRTKRYDEATGWFEQAITAKEKGDIHGRIDHQSLGQSLTWFGYCQFQTSRYQEARPHYERAIAEKEKGDIFGKVDRESIKITIQILIACLRKLNLEDEARTWESRIAKSAQA